METKFHDTNGPPGEIDTLAVFGLAHPGASGLTPAIVTDATRGPTPSFAKFFDAQTTRGS